LTSGFIILWIVIQMPIKKIIFYLKFLLIMVLFITLMQMLFGPGSHYIIKPLIPEHVPFIGGAGSLKLEGLFMGITSGLRLLSLVLVLPLLLGTTTVHKLTQGLCGFRLNYKFAFVITAALNFIPVLEEEARLIIDAQKLRGLNVYDKGNLLRKLRVYPALAVPLIISAMRRSQSMAYVMDSRGFGVYPERTWLEPLKMQPRDFFAIIISIIFCGIILSINFIFFKELLWQ